eukprot:COSAG01_NODE_6961_length_3415_cov_19.882388_1_plen_184_part_00
MNTMRSRIDCTGNPCNRKCVRMYVFFFNRNALECSLGIVNQCVVGGGWCLPNVRCIRDALRALSYILTERNVTACHLDWCWSLPRGAHPPRNYNYTARGNEARARGRIATRCLRPSNLPVVQRHTFVHEQSSTIAHDCGELTDDDNDDGHDPMVFRRCTIGPVPGTTGLYQIYYKLSVDDTQS